MIVRVVTIIIIYAMTAPARVDTLTCSTWQQITTCSSPGGDVNHESQWQGVTTEDDNQRRQVDIVAVAGH
ncbi:MAG TPA: hypothetical protein VIH81_10040 [Roseiarcus sp.]